MEQCKRIGMDTSKQLFELHGVDEADAVVLRKRLRRSQMEAFFKTLAPTVIGIEACAGSHHWARLLGSFGHEVRLIPAQHAKRYVKRGKNDAADAKALCEAMARPDMQFVPGKTVDQQAGLMLIGIRERLIRSRTQLTNAIRGYAAEFGLIAPKGLNRIEPLLERIAADEALPQLARDLFAAQARHYAWLDQELEQIEAKLMAWHRADERSRRLVAIPGVGPVIATLLSMKAPAPELFRSGRDFAAWMGLTPKDHSTAGRSRPGRITRAGDEILRAALVAGATAVILQARRGSDKVSPWVARIAAAKKPKLAAVALANKTARIAWKLMVSGEAYRPADAAAGTAG